MKRTRIKSSELAKKTFKVFRNLINIESCGKWIDDGGREHPVHLITKEMRRLRERFYQGETNLYYEKRLGKFQIKDYHRNKLSARMIDGMIAGLQKFYYTGGTNGHTLLMIDTDAHDASQDDPVYTHETIDGVLHRYLFPVESTRGFNDFLKVYYDPVLYTSEEVNGYIKEFETALKDFTKAKVCHCGVEVKGTITTKGKCGSLAKLPCYGTWTFEKLQKFEDTPSLSLSGLIEATKVLHEKARQAELERDPSEVINDEQAKQPKELNFRINCGSVTGIPFDEEELEDFDNSLTFFKTAAFHLLACGKEQPKGERILIAKDYQILMRLISQLLKFPNEDGSMPHKRVKAMWDALYKMGRVDRAFDNSRYSAMVKNLIDCGYVEVEDENYWWCGEGKKGQAAKWRLKEEFAYEPETSKPVKEEEVSLREVPSAPTSDFFFERFRLSEVYPEKAIVHSDTPEQWEKLLAETLISC